MNYFEKNIVCIFMCLLVCVRLGCWIIGCLNFGLLMCVACCVLDCSVLAVDA